jgi:hypothetical protein
MQLQQVKTNKEKRISRRVEEHSSAPASNVPQSTEISLPLILMMRSLNHWRQFRIPWYKFTEIRIIASAADHKICYNQKNERCDHDEWLEFQQIHINDYEETEIQQLTRYDCVWTHRHDYYAHCKQAQVKDCTFWNAYREVYTVLLCSQEKNRKSWLWVCWHTTQS